MFYILPIKFLLNHALTQTIQPPRVQAVGEKEVRVELEVLEKYTKENVYNSTHGNDSFFSRKSFFRLIPPFFPEHELEKAFSKISIQFSLGYDCSNLF